VSRFLISPESAQGLDLKLLARAAVRRLESEMDVSGLRWIAAIHRNTVHHHVHLVVAGMRAEESGAYRRVDVTKPRLAAMKEALGLEIERQRGGREQTPRISERPRPVAVSEADSPASAPPAPRPPLAQVLHRRTPGLTRVASRATRAPAYQGGPHASSLVALRAVARRYSRQMQREVEREAPLRGWERAA